MKQVRLFLGGHKFHNQDYLYMQDGNLEVLNAIVDGLSAAPVVTILSGVNPVNQAGSFYTWSDGVVKYNNQFYFLAEQTTSTDISTISFDLDEVPDPLNPVIYRDGQSRDVHVDLQMTQRGPGGAVSGFWFLVANSLIQEVENSLFANNMDEKLNTQGWTNIPNNGAWNVASPIFQQPQVRKVGGLIELRGQVVLSSGANLFTLPAGYRPISGGAIRMFSMATGHLSAPAAIYGVTIRGDGLTEASLVHASGGTVLQAYTLDHLKFWE